MIAKNERFRSTETGMGEQLRQRLIEVAGERGLVLDFRKLERGAIRLGRISKTGEFKNLLDQLKYEIKFEEIVGGRGEGYAWGGGYVMEVRKRDTAELVCCVLGDERDGQVNPLNGEMMKPVFMNHWKDRTYVVMSGKFDILGPPFPPETVLADPSVNRKIEAIVGYIASFFPNENGQTVVRIPGGRSGMNVVRFSPGIGALQAKSLGEEIADALGGNLRVTETRNGETVEIKGLPENLEAGVKELLEAGVRDLGDQIGRAISGFNYGGEYVSKSGEMVWWASSFDPDISFCVEVKRKEGIGDELTVGLRRDFGKEVAGKPMTGAVYLGSQTVEALIYPSAKPGRFYRTIYSAGGDGWVVRHEGDRPDPGAEKLFSKIFPDRRYLFQSAIEALWYFGQKKFG